MSSIISNTIGQRRSDIRERTAGTHFKNLSLPYEVFVALDSVSLKTIRRFAMRSKRWMMAYINGLTEEQRKYAEKQ